MSEPSHIPRWNVYESSPKDWGEKYQPKQIATKWLPEYNFMARVFEAMPAAGDIT